ncbi:MAG: (2Fe-2S)-binding protein [Nitriliruptoraceae bacterium]|nr:(2Fe-2S)-binding protein [Nitriliruptoraceae bacterium]
MSATDATTSARTATSDRPGASGAVGPYDRVEVELTVNGVPRAAFVPPRRLLSDFIRHDLELTGTHVGCEHGVCGACTVLLDGQPIRSCLALAVAVDGRELTTIEGLAGPDGELHPVQQGFQDHHGLQCGFCTPGFVLSACGFLAEDPDPDEDTIREGMAGNLCRCTGYAGILQAVKQAAGVLRETGADPCARHAGRAADGAVAAGPESGR